MVTILTVLVDEHADADPRHVEAVKEVLDLALRVQIVFTRPILTHLHHPLSHGLHHRRVTVADAIQLFRESA